MKNVAVKYGWHLLYIDAFSGSGSQHIKKDLVGEVDLEGKEITDFVEGSTMRALAVTKKLEAAGTNDFEHFDFIDMNQDAIAELRANVEAEHPESTPIPLSPFTPPSSGYLPQANRPSRTPPG